ncbi:uncharacterized protein LOC121428339 isoform X2 [Lytechinus variegatus]|uniref:uncharacterized protein LOC121428339 isoform X2 n=1 Tax=Lytechinus variegatus TaxID=7654 RepID=UPI001BB1922E|nr:uncharacterized protein LOC121428339 isoform X2 [Lytechinus variegatus]
MSAKVIVICLLLGILSEVDSVAHGRLRNKGVQARSCVVSDFQVQEDFNIQQYVGTWYTISQNGESPESFHRRSHYSLQENGALAMTTRRVSPQNGCASGMEFQADAHIPEGSTTPAKLLLQPRGVPMHAEDYWVIYTDYVDHALVYSCSQKNEDGTCPEDRARVWFLGRSGTLSVQARHHVESLLLGLCVDVGRMQDIPTECDAELGVPSSVESMPHAHGGMAPTSCLVSEIQTLENFNKNQYTGTWYVISHLQGSIYPYHRISHYTLDEENSFRMLTHRITSAGECSAAWKFEGQAYNPDTSDVTSKMVLKPFGMPVYGEDYWVIYTDYTDHALIYSCRETNEDGTCTEDASHAWMMSRNPTLTPAARSHMEMLLTDMCVDVSRFIDTPHECDELLGPDTLIDQGPANECVVHSFETMPNFDKDRYQGTWYVISHLEESVYPYQRISNYTLEADGSFTMATERITSQGACDSAMRFEATASQPAESTTSSKLTLRPRGMDVEGEDYWIVYTDYTHYALVYSCGTKNLDGTCQEDAAKVWLLSRHPKMSDFARSYLVSRMRDLCMDPRNLVDTPSECDEALGVARADRCSVEKFSVMRDFDMSRYAGAWYMIKSLRNDVHPYQRISQYSLHHDGSILMTSDGIQSGPDQCDTTWHFEAKATLGDPQAAKLTLKPIGIPAQGEDYWVIYTDYTDHALVYSCSDKKLDGTCKEGAVHAYVMSRNTTLSDQAMGHVNMLLEAVCVDPNAMIPTPSECDHVLEMGIRRPVVELARSCVVDELPIMEDFDIARYAGAWYTVSQIQPFEYPFHRVSNYVLQDNGRLLMSTDQFFRPGNCSTMHFDAHAFHLDREEGDSKPINGKLFLQPLDSRVPPGNYWVAYTDYTDHALVYSCIRKNVSGECMKGYSMAWFMSRNPGLSEGAITHMKHLLGQLCVDPARLRDVITACDAAIGISSEARSPCDISTFQVKENFVIDKFMGDWYELSHIRGENRFMVVPDNEKMSITAPSGDNAGHIAITMKNIRLDGECLPNDMPGMGWLGREEPAKIVVSFPLIPEGYQVPQVVNYWVLDTDYDNYAIMYTCHRIKRDGTCDPLAMGLWILGRERQIQPRFWATVQRVIEEACVDQATVQANPAPCPQESNAGPAPVDNVVCEDIGFGCCLLSAEAAVDADYSNCPRVAPPVAGQMIPEAPVSIVEAVCDKRLNCKMFCRFGFKRDSDNCEICACAEAPILTPDQPRHRGRACQRRYDIVMAKLKNNPPRNGFYVPQCDEDGNYHKLQCLYPQERCWCANTETGQRVGKARYNGDTPSCAP